MAVVPVLGQSLSALLCLLRGEGMQRCRELCEQHTIGVALAGVVGQNDPRQFSQALIAGAIKTERHFVMMQEQSHSRHYSPSSTGFTSF